MKILVVSDTHHRIDRILRILPHLEPLDLIIHLGDYISDANHLKAETKVPVISVGGNCDGVTVKGEAMEIIGTPYGNILATHGHLHGVKRGLERLFFQAQELECKAVVYGHTHVPYHGVYGGIHLVNPGSISFPRDNASPTYAILTLEKDRFDCSLVTYSDEMADALEQGSRAKGSGGPGNPDAPDASATSGNQPRKKPAGGFLRNLMNHSDRF